MSSWKFWNLLWARHHVYAFVMFWTFDVLKEMFSKLFKKNLFLVECHMCHQGVKTLHLCLFIFHSFSVCNSILNCFLPIQKLFLINHLLLVFYVHCLILAVLVKFLLFFLWCGSFNLLVFFFLSLTSLFFLLFFLLLLFWLSYFLCVCFIFSCCYYCHFFSLLFEFS